MSQYCPPNPHKTQVVRLKKYGTNLIQDCDVYIGRKQHNDTWNLAQSKWANPYVISPPHNTRKDVCEQYEQYIRSSPHLLRDLHELLGKRLGCWCKPQECHGDILIKLMQERGMINKNGYTLWTTSK